ncbi:MAG: CPBP family intramembrane metalloprotease [Acidobacteriota bacterium]|nr:CPBP family intramembrane metalloprotease [Acidobacteriota bacterium]
MPENPATQDDVSISIHPDSPPWNSGAAFGVWLFSIFALVILVNAAVLIYAFTNQINLAQIAEAIQKQTNPNILLVNILATIPAHLLTIGVVWLVVTRGGKFPFFQMLGWNWGKNFGFWASVGTAIGFFLFAGLLVSLFGETENDLMRILRSSRAAVYATAFLATFTAPLIEETVYRGVMYSAFRRTFGQIGAVILVTFLFALVHVPQYYPSYGVILAILLLSLVLTLVRAWTGNLLPCVVIHTVFNGVQSILLIAEPFLFPKTNAPADLPTVFIFPFLFK